MCNRLSLLFKCCLSILICLPSPVMALDHGKSGAKKSHKVALKKQNRKHKHKKQADISVKNTIVASDSATQVASSCVRASPVLYDPPAVIDLYNGRPDVLDPPHYGKAGGEFSLGYLFFGNGDSLGCPPSTFEIDVSMNDAMFSAIGAPTRFTLAPGETTTNAIQKMKISDGIPDGYYQLKLAINNLDTGQHFEAPLRELGFANNEIAIDNKSPTLKFTAIDLNTGTVLFDAVDRNAVVTLPRDYTNTALFLSNYHESPFYNPLDPWAPPPAYIGSIIEYSVNISLDGNDVLREIIEGRELGMTWFGLFNDGVVPTWIAAARMTPLLSPGLHTINIETMDRAMNRGWQQITICYPYTADGNPASCDTSEPGDEPPVELDRLR